MATDLAKLRPFPDPVLLPNTHYRVHKNRFPLILISFCLTLLPALESCVQKAIRNTLTHTPPASTHHPVILVQTDKIRAPSEALPPQGHVAHTASALDDGSGLNWTSAGPTGRCASCRFSFVFCFKNAARRLHPTSETLATPLPRLRYALSILTLKPC